MKCPHCGNFAPFLLIVVGAPSACHRCIDMDALLYARRALMMDWMLRSEL